MGAVRTDTLTSEGDCSNTYRKMKVLCFSLIVLQCSVSAAVTAVKYLGLPAPALGYTTQSISPSIYPLRTALDVLQPSLPRYTFPWAPATAGYYPAHAPVVSVQSPLFSAPAFAPVAVPTKILTKPVATDEEPVAVDVAEEITDDGVRPLGEITIRKEVDSLPSLSASNFRGTNTPVIPAGIVQATQPHFVQTIFKNDKLSPSLQFVSQINSKVSPVLQEIKASGVTVF